MKIGSREIGHAGQACYVIAEIGINHNGDMRLAHKLIAAAALAGCDAVKFQKRDVEAVYTAEDLDQPRQSPRLTPQQCQPKRQGKRRLAF